jgi:hypothetical protein
VSRPAGGAARRPSYTSKGAASQARCLYTEAGASSMPSCCINDIESKY